MEKRDDAPERALKDIKEHPLSKDMAPGTRFYYDGFWLIKARNGDWVLDEC